MKFFLKTVTPKVITSCLEVLKDILQDVNIFIKPDGLKILVYDVARVALIDLFLPSENFEEYTCTNNIIAGISISNTYKILKSITTTDTLEMIMTGPDHLTINIYNVDKKSRTEFVLKLLEIDEEVIQQPNLPVKCTTTISATEFQKICRDMSNLSSSSNGTIDILRSKNTLNLSFSGDFADQNTTIECSDYNGPDIKGSFSLKYMLMFTKATAISSNLQLLQSDSDDPLILKYLVANLGELNFYIHPLSTDLD